MESFIDLTTMVEIEKFIETNELAFIFISKPNCSICESLLPQIEKVMEQYPTIENAIVNTELVPEVAGRFSIFTVPVLILFYQGKEYLREARIVPIKPFNEKIERIVKGVQEEKLLDK